MTQIPYAALSPDVLRAVIEEFVTRDGAIHGHGEQTIEISISAVLAQLKAGKACLVYDEDAETCNVVMTDTTGGAAEFPE